MFDQASIRIVAGALLWSTAMAVLSIAFHARLFGVRAGVEDLEYMHSIIRCTVGGAFFGAFFGGIINAPKHPFYINLGASIAFVFGVATARALTLVTIVPDWPSWANGLLALFVLGILGAVGGAIYRKFGRFSRS